MATAQSVVSSALTILGVIFPGQTPSASMSGDGLTRLNEMLASWTIDRLLIYGIARNTFTLSGGVFAYTIGSGGSLNVARPNSIEFANIITPSLSLRSPLKLVTTEEWAQITDKTTTGTVPSVLYNDYEYPLSNILLWPIPNSAATQLELFTWQILTQFATLADTFDFPAGYEQAIIWNLATVLSPIYGRPMTPEAMQTAMDAKNSLKGINAPPTHVSGKAEEAIARANLEQATQALPTNANPPLKR